MTEPFKSARVDAFDQIKTAGDPSCFLGDHFARETGQHPAICVVDHFHDFGSDPPVLAAVGQNRTYHSLIESATTC